MNKFIRYSIRALVITVGAVIAIWVIGWSYVQLNEASLIDKLSSKIKERARGEVRIGGLSVSLWRTFPLLSLQLSQVVVRDSLFPIHHKDFLRAENIYLRLSIPGLITGHSPVGKLIVADGALTILTDSSGVTNTYIFKSGNKQPDHKKESDENAALPDITFKSVLITFINPLRAKFHQLAVSKLDCSISQTKERYSLDIAIDGVFNSLAFNTEKGSYVKNKLVGGRFGLLVNKADKKLLINQAQLSIDRHPFLFNGWFRLDKASPDFNLSIQVKDINYTKLVSLLADSQQVKLNSYSFKKPVSLRADLSGKTYYRYIPLAQITMEVKDNDLTAPMGTFENCSFKGKFTNENIPGKPRLDDNARIDIREFSASWEKIRLKSNSIQLSNLIAPFLECDLRSYVDLPSLNSLTGSGAFSFLKGSATVNILFKGPVSGRDSVVANLNGDIAIKDASIKYLPRNFTLLGCTGLLRFKNNDLFVDAFKARTGQTLLQMNGHAENFLSMLNVSPEKLALHWKVYSDHLHLEDFKAFLSKSGEQSKKSDAAKFKGASSKVDKLFNDGDMYVAIETPAMDYKRFLASDVHADIILKPTSLALENMRFRHAKGAVVIQGIMNEGKAGNPIELHAQMKNMDVPSLFTAFDNFGQDALTYANLKGRLSADIDFASAITNKAKLVNEASQGAISFLLEEGELNDFDPIRKVSEKVFKKQDFSAIRFADLKNKLQLKGYTFIINEMEIKSTALHFFVEGIYDIKKGTDMSIRLPVRNLLKSQADTDLSDSARKKPGVTVRLRARTADDGKLKLSWDPFKRSVKNKEDAIDSVAASNNQPLVDSTKVKH